MLKKCLFVAATLAVALGQTAAHAGVLDQVKSTGEFKIGFRESSVPFAYRDQNERPVGYSVDLCVAIADKIKQALKLPSLTIKYVPVGSSNRIPLMKSGAIDIECGSTGINNARKQQVDFSVATYVTNTLWMVKNDSGVKRAADLKGKQVVLTQGSTVVQYAKSANERDNLNLKMVLAHDHAESMLMLSTGRAVAFMEDDVILAAQRANAADPQDYSMLPEVYSKHAYGMMLPKGDVAFKKIVDDSLKEMMASGAFMQVYKKWFESPIPPRNAVLNIPPSAELQERIAHPSDAVLEE